MFHSHSLVSEGGLTGAMVSIWRIRVLKEEAERTLENPWTSRSRAQLYSPGIHLRRLTACSSLRTHSHRRDGNDTGTHSVQVKLRAQMRSQCVNRGHMTVQTLIRVCFDVFGPCISAVIYSAPECGMQRLARCQRGHDTIAKALDQI